MTELDANFNAVVAIVNGNLNENNVKMAADSVLLGGKQIAASPVANKITKLDASAYQPWDAKATRQMGKFTGSNFQGAPFPNDRLVDTGRTFNGQPILNLVSYHGGTLDALYPVSMRQVLDGNDGIVVPAGAVYGKFMAHISGTRVLSTATGYLYASIEKIAGTNELLASHFQDVVVFGPPQYSDILINTGWIPVTAGDVVGLFEASTWPYGSKTVGNLVWYFSYEFI